METTEINVEQVLDAEEISRPDVLAVRKKAALSKEERDKLQEKLARLEKAVKREQDPQKVKDDSLKLGILLWMMGRVKEAAEVLQEVKSRKVGLYYLGKCCQELGEYEKALECFERAQRTDAEEFDILMDIVESKRKAGDVQVALKTIEKLFKEHDRDAELHYQWGECLEALGEYEKAVSHYEKAVELDPEHAKALFRLAYDFDLEGEDQKAVEYYERCKKLSPTYTNVLVNLGVLYEERGEFEKALSCFEQVLRVEPNHPRARLYLKDAKASLSMYYDEEKAREQDKRSQVLDIPISDFELSVRSKNCLERMNIRTLRDLTKVTEAELLSYKNFGETSLSEIKNMLSQKGLRLGQALEEEQQKAIPFRVEPGKEEEALASPLIKLELSTRCKKALEKLDIQTVRDLVSKSEDDLLAQKNFRRWYVDEIKEKLAKCGLSLKATASEEESE